MATMCDRQVAPEPSIRARLRLAGSVRAQAQMRRSVLTRDDDLWHEPMTRCVGYRLHRMSFAISRLNVINLFADDLERTKTFYREVLGMTLVFEDPNHNVFKLENLIVNLVDRPAAESLVAPAFVAPADAGAWAVLSVFVDDLAVACAELVERGVELVNGPVDRPWGVRTASFFDPGGNLWEVAQDLDAA